MNDFPQQHVKLKWRAVEVEQNMGMMFYLSRCLLETVVSANAVNEDKNGTVRRREVQINYSSSVVQEAISGRVQKTQWKVANGENHDKWRGRDCVSVLIKMQSAFKKENAWEIWSVNLLVYTREKHWWELLTSFLLIWSWDIWKHAATLMERRLCVFNVCDFSPWTWCNGIVA